MAVLTASPTTPGGAFHVPRPTAGILAPVLRSKCKAFPIFFFGLCQAKIKSTTYFQYHTFPALFILRVWLPKTDKRNQLVLPFLELIFFEPERLLNGENCLFLFFSCLRLPLSNTFMDLIFPLRELRHKMGIFQKFQILKLKKELPYPNSKPFVISFNHLYNIMILPFNHPNPWI